MCTRAVLGGLEPVSLLDVGGGAVAKEGGVEDAVQGVDCDGGRVPLQGREHTQQASSQSIGCQTDDKHRKESQSIAKQCEW